MPRLELIDQLNRKEYAVQRLEQRCQKALDIIKSLAQKEPEVTQFPKELRDEMEASCKITNVVEANNKLRNGLTLK